MARLLKTICWSLLFVIVLTAGSASASELTLLADQSAIRYEATKYGTMSVEGVLQNPVGAGLSGQLLIKRADETAIVSGDVILTQPVFNSQHIRRDDEVNALFMTPIELAVITTQPCIVKLGVCSFEGTLHLNNKTRTYQFDVSFYKEYRALLAVGALAIERGHFDLEFNEGFAATLDVAIAQQVEIHFRLAFSVSDVSVLSELPDKTPLSAAESDQANPLDRNTSSWLERLRSWVGAFWE